jgi:hypothetical protein
MEYLAAFIMSASWSFLAVHYARKAIRGSRNHQGHRTINLLAQSRQLRRIL